MSAYNLTADGNEALLGRLERIERELRELRGTNGLESAVIGAGGVTVRDGGGITVTGGGALTIADGSTLVGRTGNEDGLGGVYFGQIYPTNLYKTGLAIDDDGGPARVLFAEQQGGGFESFISGTNSYLWADNFLDIRAPHLDIRAPLMQVYSPRLALLNLPTTSAAANLHLGTVGGVWTVALVTSSRRYKRDIRPTTVKPENVLAVEAKTFLEKSEVDAVGAAAPWRHGFIAEEVAEVAPQFVGLDEDGDPNSVDYDRFAAIGHQVVLQDHEARVGELETENAALRQTVADLTTRLEALETK